MRPIDSCITQLKTQGPVTKVKKKKKVETGGVGAGGGEDERARVERAPLYHVRQLPVPCGRDTPSATRDELSAARDEGVSSP